MQIIEKSINDITPYENNPRKNDEAVELVKNSIKEFGFKVPIVIDKDGVIVAGHTRLKAAKKLGLKTVPCIIADDLNDDQIKAFRLADNKVGEAAEWDLDLLKLELDDLAELDIDMSEFGFEEEEEELEAEEDDFDESEVDDEPITQLGDLYQLGNHRLYCGDSTDRECVEVLMNGQKADLVLTDPPYGIKVVKGNTIGGDKPFGSVGDNNIVKANNYSQIIGDETTETAEKSFKVFKEYSNNQIIFGGNYFTEFLPPKACWIVWDKENTGNFADVELAWTSFEKGAKLYKWLWNGLCRKGDRKVEGVKRVHPTQKPVGLIGDILTDFSKDGDIVLDLFGGSGSTLIACEQLNRQCYMMELDPHYCDVIIARWEKLTGEKAVKLN